MAKSPQFKFKSFIQRKDGNGYDVFTDLPIEERREYWEKVNFRLAEIEAKCKGLKIEKIERTTETA